MSSGRCRSRGQCTTHDQFVAYARRFVKDAVEDVGEQLRNIGRLGDLLSNAGLEPLAATPYRLWPRVSQRIEVPQQKLLGFRDSQRYFTTRYTVVT
jgi:hypothetical protein